MKIFRARVLHLFLKRRRKYRDFPFATIYFDYGYYSNNNSHDERTRMRIRKTIQFEWKSSHRNIQHYEKTYQQTPPKKNLSAKSQPPTGISIKPNCYFPGKKESCQCHWTGITNKVVDHNK